MLARASCLALLISFLVVPLAADDTKAPAKETTYLVPFRLVTTNHIVVRAKINGKGPYNFIVDTGAPALYLSQALGKKIGLTSDKNGWSSFDRLEIEGGVVVPKAQGRMEDLFQLEGMNGLGVSGVELHGVIGYNILARYRIEYDLSQEKLKWTALDFEPDLPARIGKGAVPGGLNAMGGILKFAGAMLGSNAQKTVVLRSFLGIELTDADGSIAVKTVLSKGPAESAGLAAGDQLLKVQNKPVKNLQEVLKAIASLKAGESVRLTINRNNASQEITIKPGEGL